MSEFIKAWTTVLVLAVQVFFLVGILTATMDVSAAERYHGQVTAEIENSNFNDEVIDICKSEANNRGYQLEITKLVMNQSRNKQVAEVKLTYKFRVGILNINQDHIITGMAG